MFTQCFLVSLLALAVLGSPAITPEEKKQLEEWRARFQSHKLFQDIFFDEVKKVVDALRKSDDFSDKEIELFKASQKSLYELLKNGNVEDFEKKWENLEKEVAAIGEKITNYKITDELNPDFLQEGREIFKPRFDADNDVFTEPL